MRPHEVGRGGAGGSRDLGGMPNRSSRSSTNIPVRSARLKSAAPNRAGGRRPKRRPSAAGPPAARSPEHPPSRRRPPAPTRARSRPRRGGGASSGPKMSMTPTAAMPPRTPPLPRPGAACRDEQVRQADRGDHGADDQQRRTKAHADPQRPDGGPPRSVAAHGLRVDTCPRTLKAVTRVSTILGRAAPPSRSVRSHRRRAPGGVRRVALFRSAPKALTTIAVGSVLRWRSIRSWVSSAGTGAGPARDRCCWSPGAQSSWWWPSSSGWDRRRSIRPGRVTSDAADRPGVLRPARRGRLARRQRRGDARRRGHRGGPRQDQRQERDENGRGHGRGRSLDRTRARVTVAVLLDGEYLVAPSAALCRTVG